MAFIVPNLSIKYLAADWWHTTCSTLNKEATQGIGPKKDLNIFPEAH